MNRATIIELPGALCVNNAPSLAALVARDDSTMSVAKLYVGKNFDFTGSPAASFTLLQVLTRFAWYGTLTSDYGADTLTIDLERGTSLQLDGPDIILDEVTPFDALANTVLVVIGNEILSLAGATLTAAGAYRILTVRGRFGTPVEFHAAGSVVFLIRLEDLAAINLPSLKAGNTGQFKLVRGVDNLADQDTSTVAFTGGCLQLPPPAQLMVDGMLTPLVDSGTDLVMSWKLPAAGLLGKSVSTLLEFIVPGEDTVSVLVPWSTETLTKPWADLPAAATDGFTLRASTQVSDGDNLVTGESVQVFVNAIGGAGGSLAPTITAITPDTYAPSGVTDMVITGTGFTNTGGELLHIVDSLGDPAGVDTAPTYISPTELHVSVSTGGAMIGETLTYTYINANGTSNPKTITCA